MDNRAVNAFFLHLAKCLKDNGVTNHAVRQGFKLANLTMREAKINPKFASEVDLLTSGLATAYYELE